MGFKSLFQLKETVSLLFQTEAGEPYAVRLDLPSLHRLLFFATFFFFLFFLGTLLFFRELESTRRLEQRVLELELQNRLNETLTKIRLEVPGALAPLAPKTKAKPAVKAQPKKVEAAPVTKKVAAAPKVVPAPKAAPVKTQGPAVVRANITQLAVGCGSGVCDAKIQLLPNSPGVSRGQLLVVLEAEVTRIGGSGPEAAARKKYIVYPGYQRRDTLTQAELTTIQGSPYKFYQGLKRTVSFTLGKMIRPIAVTAYLFDEDRNIIDSRREAIQGQP